MINFIRKPFDTRLLALVAGLTFCIVPSILQAQAQDDDAAIKTREENFTKQMENTVLVGFFTLDDQKQDQLGKPERYEIRKVTKATKNTWIFQTRVKYGSIDTVLPILVPIEWAGDTPIVSMTDFTIPGMGTFTCRVMFYKDRYAGTWQHGKKGGHMWGKIDKVEQ
ncbi:MAG: hypothetical protein JKY95_17395 [Planctomycetaceae bacterium]|nr:hypothetical protein [Planctomycetaceae bacterium]